MIYLLKFAAILWVVLYHFNTTLPGKSLLQTNPDTMTIEYHPIGIFHTDLTPLTGAPRQGILHPKNKGIIEIYDEYSDALRELENFEFIFVLYHMHLSGGWHSIVRPPNSKKSFGMFASRSPNRPNPIGLSVIRLDKIENNKLYVSGVDAFDGTPVLDIKPWIPSIDCPRHNNHNEIEEDLGLE